MLDQILDILINLAHPNTVSSESFQIGQFVKWHEMLGLCGVVFAISEFMEKNNLKTYIFKFSGLGKIAYELILLSIICVVGANAIYLLHQPNSFVVRCIGYPWVWEIISLASFTICIAILLFVSIFNRIPRLNKGNHVSFLGKIANVIVNNNSEESMSAITIILDKNLEQIFQQAARYNDWWDAQGSKDENPYERHKVKKSEIPIVKRSVSFIRNTLSDERFCNYISRRSLYFVYGLIDKLGKYSLPHGCELFFMSSLYRELFINEDSHLSREMDYRGLGLNKPLFNKIFSSLSLIHSANPYSLTFFEFDARKNAQLLDKYTVALEISLNEYLKQGNMWGVSFELRKAFQTLAEALSSLCIEIKEIQGEAIYDNKRDSGIHKIGWFFHRLEQLLTGNGENVPNLEQSELLVQKDSLTEGIAESIFEYLDALTVLKNDDYARYLSTQVFWVLLPVGNDHPLIQSMAKKIFNLIKERIEENKKNRYSSMIRLMINIYGFRWGSVPDDKNIIEKYLYDEFQSSIAPSILESRDTKHLPSKYAVNFDRRAITNLNGEVIFQEAQQWTF